MDSKRRLLCFLNTMALYSLPEQSSGFRADANARLELVKEAGFDGIQFANPATEGELAHCRALGLRVCGSGRINRTEDAKTLAELAAKSGYECVTLHVGWGLEDDKEAARLIE